MHLMNLSRLQKIGSWEFNCLTKSFIWSKEYYNIFQVEINENKPLFDTFFELLHPSDVILFENLLFSNNIDKDIFSFEYRIICNDGKLKYIWCKGVFVRDNLGNVIRIKGTGQDISQRKKYEKEIASNEMILNELLSNINEVVFSVELHDDATLGNKLSFINGNAKFVFEFSQQEFMNSEVQWMERIHPDDKEKVFKLTQELDENKSQILRQYRFLHKNGQYIWLEDNISLGLSDDGKTKKIYGSVRDISERKKAEELLISNEEKIVLLKEIHHRVKNNLQVITSLLSLQSSFVINDDQKKLFSDSQFRINSMAIVHEMLYQSDNLSKINYYLYLKELVNYLITSMKGKDAEINLEINVTDINLSIDTAVPLGLLINEIITNSLKYAFPSNHGSIFISINKNQKDNTDDTLFHMNIGDNGIGYAGDINFDNSKSLGMKLIKSLSRQLGGGIIKDDVAQGTHYTLTFEEI